METILVLRFFAASSRTSETCTPNSRVGTTTSACTPGAETSPRRSVSGRPEPRASPVPGVQALGVVPTRELCVQVSEDLELAAKNRNTKIVSIYGGKAYEGQIEQLK